MWVVVTVLAEIIIVLVVQIMLAVVVNGNYNWIDSCVSCVSIG